MTARDVPGPLAVLEGSQALAALELPLGCLTWFVLGLPAVAVAQELLPGVVQDVPWTLTLGLALSLLTAVTLAGHALARRRTGRTEVFPDRLLVWKTERTGNVFLRDLVAFDDASTDHVRLLERGVRRALSIATPDPAGRAALLRALTEAGVPRAEGRRDVAEVPPRLVARGRSVPWAYGLLLVGALGPLALGVLLWPLLGAWALPLALLPPPLAVVALQRLLPRSGTATFRDDRVELAVHPCFVAAWGDVVGWTGHEGHVRLRLRRGIQVDSHVPTLTPEVRAAVEALLAEKGVPRL